MTADPAMGGLGPSRAGAATAAFTYAGALYGGGTTGLVSDMTVTSAQTGTGVFAPLHWRYTYDALGNITLLQELNSSNAITGSTAYTYDSQSQLTQASRNNGGQIWNYSYDGWGNLRSRDYRVAYVIRDQVAYTYGDADWLDLLTAVSGKKNGVNFSGSYVYDGAGNPTSYYNVGDLSSWTMTWKNGRQLATASNGTHTVSYDYDLDGLRTCKIVDGVRHDYFYAGGQLLRETYTQSGTAYVLDFLYDQNGRPFLLYLTQTTGGITTSAPYYYILNLQGDVIHLVDASGVPAASYSYDPYGNALTATGSLASVNPLRYRGYYFDPESGLYYLQSRYYDPMLGRFINGDGYASTGQGFLGYNMFAYCGNNPVIHIDKSGEYEVVTYQYSYDVVNINGSGTTHYEGTVYICVGTDIDGITFFDDPANRPEGYVEGRDIIVVDVRSYEENPTMIVYNSYTIKNSAKQDAVISVLLKHEQLYPSQWERTQSSMKTEWFWHNAFALFSDQAKHTDFDNQEEGKGGAHFIKKAWDRAQIEPKALSFLRLVANYLGFKSKQKYVLN